MKNKYYIGDGKLLFNITRVIEKSDITESDKVIIIDELNKLALSAQRLSEFITSLDVEYDRLKAAANLITN